MVDIPPRHVAGSVSGRYSLGSRGHLEASAFFLPFSPPCSQGTCHSQSDLHDGQVVVHTGESVMLRWALFPWEVTTVAATVIASPG